ncbi:MAG: ferredoxin [Bacteriovoracaceae bacterium]
MKYNIHFTNGETIEIEEGLALSEALDITSSPILFGCRTGICATCLVKVHSGAENLPEITEDEQEVIELSTDEKNCRLACCLSLKGDITLEYIGK